jgi:hypothetical protein
LVNFSVYITIPTINALARIINIQVWFLATIEKIYWYKVHQESTGQKERYRSLAIKSEIRKIKAREPSPQGLACE